MVMVLQDIFDQLTAGELRKNKLGGSRDGSQNISPDDYYIVIPLINAAILEVHKRLPIRTESVTILQSPYITMYKLHTDFAATNTASPKRTKYIRDSIYYPFKNTVLSIVSVLDMGGHTLPINDTNNLHSVYTPTHNTVQMPYPRENYTMDVVYRATIEPIPKDLTTDPAEYTLDIPDYCMQAILAFVQSRLEVGMIRGENVQSEFAALAKFEQACQLVERQSLIPGDAYTNTKHIENGWV